MLSVALKKVIETRSLLKRAQINTIQSEVKSKGCSGSNQLTLRQANTKLNKQLRKSSQDESINLVPKPSYLG